MLHVNRAGGDKGVNTSGVGTGQCFSGAIDVRIHCARQAADDTVLDSIGNQLDRFEVAGAGNRKTGLNHIDPQLLQRASNAQLLILGHGRARALFPVAQGSIEDDDLIL